VIPVGCDVRECNWRDSGLAEGEASAGGPTRMLAHFALVNNTASLWSVPRASAMNFPSGDQP
jgi:hypothetical protein